MGIDVTPSPSFSITPFIFRFLKSLDLQSVGLSIGSLAHLLPFVNPSQKVMGKEMVVYDSVVAESREVGNESMSTEEFSGCGNVVVENLEELVLNGDPVGDIDVDNSDEYETILRFKWTVKTVPQPPLRLQLVNKSGSGRPT